MQNGRGRYWSILSLEKVKLGERLDTDGLKMFDDYREVCYEFGVTIKLDYHQPRVPQGLHATQPESWPARVSENRIRKDQRNAGAKTKINSFLYGNNAGLAKTSSNFKPVPATRPPKKQAIDKKQEHKYTQT